MVYCIEPVLADKSFFKKPMKASAKIIGNKTYTESKTKHQSLMQHDYGPTTFSSCAWNEYASLRGRALAETPQIDRNEVNRFCRWVKTNFCILFKGHWKCRPITVEQYLLKSNATPQVKASILRASQRLLEQGISHETKLSSKTLHRFSKRKAFIKTENNLYKTPNGEKMKAPRLIQGAQAEFIALVGPMFVPIQHMIKTIWDGSNGIMFTCGKTNVEIGKYLDFPGKVFENDVSSWDASICRPLCELEVFMARKFGATKIVLDLMNANISTHGSTTHGFKYSVDGTRKSGDPYTSLFNSILNALIHVYCFVRNGHDVSTVLSNVRMCVQGDDNIMIYNSMSPRFNLILRLGFKSECINRRDLGEAEFCSARFYRANGSWVLFPKIGRVLAKLAYFVDPPKCDLRQVLRGVAIGYQNCCCIPGFKELQQLVARVAGFGPILIPKQEDFRITNAVCYCTEEEDIYNKYLNYNYYGVDVSEAVKQYPIGLSTVLFDRDTAGPQTLFCRK